MFSVIVLHGNQKVAIEKSGFLVRPDDFTRVIFPDTEVGRDCAKTYIMEMMKLEYLVICQLDLGE